MYRYREQAVELDERGRRVGIVAAAKEFGVTYPHLYLVLSGARPSKRLMLKVRTYHPELLEV